MLSKFLSIVVKHVKIIFAKFDNLSRNKKWRYLSPSNQSNENFSVHFLVVKDPRYVDVLQTCMDSFLYWHPKARITIHLDSFTKKMVKTKILDKGRYKHLEILEDMDFPDQSWQELKLKLIVSLNGTTDVYLDADMRWNGTLRISEEVTFLTTEFRLRDKTGFLVLLNNLRSREYLDAYMRNTSFFTFGGVSIATNLISDINLMHKEIKALINTDLFGIEDKPNFLRISEQLALSLATQDWNCNIGHIKDLDKYKDGAFVESSYFGSTGTRF